MTHQPKELDEIRVELGRAISGHSVNAGETRITSWNPDLLDEVEEVIEKYYIPRSKVEEAIGEDEPEPEHTADNVDRHRAWNVKRQLRAEIRQKLGLGAK